MFGSCSGCGLLLWYPKGSIALSLSMGHSQPSVATAGAPSSLGRVDQAVNNVHYRNFSPWKEPSNQAPSREGNPGPGPPEPSPWPPSRRRSRICKLLTRTSCVGDGGFAVGEQTPPADAFTSRFIGAREENETMWSRCAEPRKGACHLEADGNFLKGECGRALKGK